MLLRDLKLSRFICKFIINEITRTVKVGNDLLRVYRGLHLTSLYSYMYDHINVLNELYSKLQKKTHLNHLKHFAMAKVSG